MPDSFFLPIFTLTETKDWICTPNPVELEKKHERGEIPKGEIQEEIRRLKIWAAITLPGRLSQSQKVSQNARHLP